MKRTPDLALAGEVSRIWRLIRSWIGSPQIKNTPSALTLNQQRLPRFVGEAQAALALNHVTSSKSLRSANPGTSTICFSGEQALRLFPIRYITA
jgi:hypothetical protein